MADCNAICRKGVSMMQGDSWPLKIRLTYGGQPLKTEDVAVVEVSVDDLIKTWPTGGVDYDSATGLFAFWPTQEESFNLRGQAKVQVRVKFK